MANLTGVEVARTFQYVGDFHVSPFFYDILQSAGGTNKSPADDVFVRTKCALAFMIKVASIQLGIPAT